MNKNITLLDEIVKHCDESMELGLSSERHLSWKRACPEMNDIDFIQYGLLRCVTRN